MSAPSYLGCTDQLLLGWLQDSLLEPNNGGQSMATNMFTIAQMINAIQQSSLDFQRDTGIVSCHAGYQGDTSSAIGVTPGTEQVQLPQDTMDVRRLAWIAYDVQNPVQVVSITELPRQDSFALDLLNPAWENTLGQPYTADESLPPIPSVNISNQPSDIGALDVLYTPVPTALSNTGVPLSFPPDCAVGVFYRALQLLFSLQGEGEDDARSRWAGTMYGLVVQLTKSLQYMTNLVPVQ